MQSAMTTVRRLFLNGNAKNINLGQLRTDASSTTTCRRLEGKVAIVTASTEGIGLAIAKRLGQEGAKVVISSRKEANVSKAVGELEKLGLTVFGIPCHVGKASDITDLIKKTADKFGGIDILVSNAAANPTVGPVLQCSESAWDKIFEVNVKGAFLLSQQVLPYMQQRGGGSIVYVSSIMGLQPSTVIGAYSVSKTALLGLTKAAAQQTALDNIRVNCVAPGIIKTKFSSMFQEPGEIHDMVLQQVPLGRIAETSEISGVVAFLCSEDASYITGETIVAAGGMQSRL